MKNSKGVYKITNKINNKFYFGSTGTSFKSRWKKHLTLLKHNKHENKYLQSAWNRNGIDNFEFSIILCCDSENCLYYEQLILNKYFDCCNQCYNICPIAAKPPSPIGIKRSAETREKIRQSRIGKKRAPFSEEAKKNMSKASIGNKNAVGNTYMLGKTLSNDTRKKISQSTIGKKPWNKSKHPGVRRNGIKWQAAIKISNTLLYLGTFGTQEEASKAYNTAVIKLRNT